MSNFVSNENANTLLDAVGKKKLTVTDVMPQSASAAIEGIPYLYLGATTLDFTNGSIYVCQEVTPATDPKTYEWVEKYQSTVDLSYYKRIWGGTETGWELLTDEQKAQYEYMFFDGDDSYYLSVVDAVTKNDMHPVTSNAVAEEVEDLDAEIADIVNVYSAKNLLKYPYYDGEQKTSAGIKYVANSDGSVTASSSSAATADSYYKFSPSSVNNPDKYEDYGLEVGKKYIFSGGVSNSVKVKYRFCDSGDVVIDEIVSTGNELVYTIPSNYSYCVAFMMVPSGITVNPAVTAKPMIRPASIKDATWESYAKTNKELTEDSVTWDDESLIGSVNFVYPTESTKQSGGVDYTVNDDNSFSAVSSSVSGGSGLQYRNDNASGLIGKTLTFRANNDAAYANGVYFAVICRETLGGSNLLRNDLYLTETNKEITFTVPANTNVILCGFNINNFTGAINLNCKPLLCLPSYNGSYVPYAKTNKELTDYLTSGKYAPKFGYIYGSKAILEGTDDEALVIKETGTEDFKDIVIKDNANTNRYKLHFAGGDVTVTTFNSSGTVIKSISLSKINQNFATQSEYIYANTLAIYKCGRMVWVTGYVPQANYSANQQTTIATIDSTKYPLPELTIRTIASYASQAYDPPEGIVYLNIANDGTVSVKTSTNLTSKSLYFSVSYIGKNLV